jgi:hypothetical protein
MWAKRSVLVWSPCTNCAVRMVTARIVQVPRIVEAATTRFWYVSNSTIRNDLQIPTVKEEISRFSSRYAARLRTHTNELIVPLTEPPTNKRLRRYWPNDLVNRF